MGHFTRQNLLHDAETGFLSERLCCTILISDPSTAVQLVKDEEDLNMCFLDYNKPFEIV